MSRSSEMKKMQKRYLRKFFLGLKDTYYIYLFIIFIIFISFNMCCVSKEVQAKEISCGVINELEIGSAKELNKIDSIEFEIVASEFTQQEKYLLAKLAMCEAEGLNLCGKIMVIETVLNRVNDNNFPETIEGVIFQKEKGVAQFSPTTNGAWETKEPNDDCWKALQIVEESKIRSKALYFESCQTKDNWHSNNLEFVTQIENMRFYK